MPQPTSALPGCRPLLQLESARGSQIQSGSAPPPEPQPVPRMICLALVVEPFQAQAAIRLLARFPIAAPPQLHSRAGITRLYADGRLRHFAVAQIECVLRESLLPAVLDSLEAAGLISSLADRLPLAAPAGREAACDCRIFRAAPDADYAQFVRWRRLPSAFAPRAAAERRTLIRLEAPAVAAAVCAPVA